MGSNKRSQSKLSLVRGEPWWVTQHSVSPRWRRESWAFIIPHQLVIEASLEHSWQRAPVACGRSTRVPGHRQTRPLEHWKQKHIKEGDRGTEMGRRSEDGQRPLHPPSCLPCSWSGSVTQFWQLDVCRASSGGVGPGCSIPAEGSATAELPTVPPLCALNAQTAGPAEPPCVLEGKDKRDALLILAHTHL